MATKHAAQLLSLADLAETLGATAEQIDVPADIRSVRKLWGGCAGAGHSGPAPRRGGGGCVTVNRHFAGPDTGPGGGDEVALILKRRP